MANGRLTKEDFEPDFLAELEAGGEHAERTDNPHGVTAAQVGLGNVDNTSDMEKPVSTAQQAAIDGIDVVEKLGFTPASTEDLNTLEQSVNQQTENYNSHASKIASTTELGHIKPDGTTITVDPETGIASALGANDYILPTATQSTLGGIKVDGLFTTVDENGILKIGTATTGAAGIVPLSDSLTSTSRTHAATANAVKQVNDKIHADSGNIVPSLSAGWTVDFTGQLSYRKIGRIVYIQGQMKATQASPQTNFLTLPVDYRPLTSQVIGKVYSYNYPNYYGHFLVNTDGRCVLHLNDMGTLPVDSPVIITCSFIT